MKYLLSVLLFVFVTAVGAQPSFFGGMVSQGGGAAQAGAGSAGASVGPGVYGTFGAAGVISGSQAQAGADITGAPGIDFTSSGASGVLAGSAVGGFSNGQAAGGSISGATGQASHYHASGFAFAFPPFQAP